MIGHQNTAVADMRTKNHGLPCHLTPVITRYLVGAFRTETLVIPACLDFEPNPPAALLVNNRIGRAEHPRCFDIAQKSRFRDLNPSVWPQLAATLERHFQSGFLPGGSGIHLLIGWLP